MIRICERCGKKIEKISFYNWTYKEYDKFYCSWSCYNHRKDAKPKKERKYNGVEVYDTDGNLMRVYKSANHAAENTGFCIKKIRRACHDGTAYNGFIWKYKNRGVV
jgi:hypothetical protein